MILYFGAVGFSLVNDRRRRRNNPDAELDDDEASDLDHTPESVDTVEPVSAVAALPEQADSNRTSRVNGYDDVT